MHLHSRLPSMADTHDGWPRRWPRFERLSKATIRITAEHELDGVLQQVVDSACEVIGARYGALGVLNSSGDGLERFVVSGVTPEEHARIGDLPTGKGILGLLITEPRPLRLADMGDHPASCGFPKHHPPMSSFLGVPILGSEQPIGNLYLAEKRGGGSFTEEDESLAVMLAAHAAVAVENARSFEEREGLLRELKRLHASRGRFFAMINHELRNALTAVHGWAELWIRKAKEDAPRAALEVRDSAEWTLTLLDDLLDLTRLEASKLEPVIRHADAWVAVHEAIGSLEPAAERKEVRIVTSGPQGPIDCHTDLKRVRQILVNLLSNAVRYSPDNEAVIVELQPSDGSVRIDVVDRGEGIAPEQHAVIFQAFERADTQTERGTGLGLALSRQLAQLLGGALTVESRLGAGARFILTLPRYPALS